MDEKLRKIFDLARLFLDTRENEEHARISCEFATRLLREEGGDHDVVLPAVILHDVGWKSIPEHLQLTAFGPTNWDMDLNRVHEQEGARIAREILEKANYPHPLVEEIVTIISEHDSRRESISINDAIVKDSDKLWRYSEHGVCFVVKGFRMSRPQYLNRLRSWVAEWFLTRTGERIAKEELQLRERRLERGE